MGCQIVYKVRRHSSNCKRCPETVGKCQIYIQCWRLLCMQAGLSEHRTKTKRGWPKLMPDTFPSNHKDQDSFHSLFTDTPGSDSSRRSAMHMKFVGLSAEQESYLPQSLLWDANYCSFMWHKQYTNEWNAPNFKHLFTEVCNKNHTPMFKNQPA